MSKLLSYLSTIPAGAALIALAAPLAFAAVNPGGPQVAGIAPPAARNMDATADVQLRFIQEDGPDSGHVRVELTPDNRPLTVFEARSAAQQAFLEALNEPGLGKNLTRITVVVRLTPGGGAGPPGPEQTVIFLHKGGSDWSVLAGE